jgi:two-component sensor histidine kinase
VEQRADEHRVKEILHTEQSLFQVSTRRFYERSVTELSSDH